MWQPAQPASQGKPLRTHFLGTKELQVKASGFKLSITTQMQGGQHQNTHRPTFHHSTHKAVTEQRWERRRIPQEP